jgi:hypothetical protein
MPTTLEPTISSSIIPTIVGTFSTIGPTIGATTSQPSHIPDSETNHAKSIYGIAFGASFGGAALLALIGLAVRKFYVDKEKKYAIKEWILPGNKLSSARDSAGDVEIGIIALEFNSKESKIIESQIYESENIISSNSCKRSASPASSSKSISIRAFTTV